MSKGQPFKFFDGSFFRLAYPDGWELEIIEQIPAIYDPHGSGALQVVASQEPQGTDFNVEQEIARYLERHQISVSDIELHSFYDRSGNECRTCEFIKDERFWMLHMTCRKDQMLLLMYNSDEIPGTELAHTISVIINSVVFKT